MNLKRFNELKTAAESLPDEAPLEILAEAPDSVKDLLMNGKAWLVEILDEAAKQSTELGRLKERIEVLNLALAEWCNEKGLGNMFYDELKICMVHQEELRRQKGQRQ